jgi:hypothetical protein
MRSHHPNTYWALAGVAALSFALLSMPMARADLNDGLVAYWNFDEGSGTILHDSVGGYNGTINGEAAWTAGVSGSALHFDGSNDYVQVASPVQSEPPYTVCAWVKPTSFGNRYVISNGGQTASAHGFCTMIYPSGLWQFGGSRADGWGGGANATAQSGAWQFVCGTWDGGLASDSIKIYLNGELIACATVGPWGSGSAQNLRIGAPSNVLAWFFQGDIDEVRIYDRALPADEVHQLYCMAAVAGDMNCDCQLDFDDITPFVLALSDPVGYGAAYPNCDYLKGDLDGDGFVTSNDVDPFVALLSGGSGEVW